MKKTNNILPKKKHISICYPHAVALPQQQCGSSLILTSHSAHPYVSSACSVAG